jgi:hypothetical protein
VIGIVGVLGVTAFLLYQSGQFARWFASDTENMVELKRLREEPPELAPPAVADAGWPQWLGPLRDGRAPAGPLRTDWDKNPPKELWSAPLGGGYSSTAVVGGRVYTQDREDRNERVHCLDAANGSTVWSFEYPANQAGLDRNFATGPRATPSVDGSRVYTVGGAGKLLCLEAAGNVPKVVWEHDLLEEFGAVLPTWGVACSPLIDGDQVIVIVGGPGAAVVAFDKLSGAVRWKAGTNPAGYSSPVAATIHGVRVIFAFTGNMLLCLRSDGMLMGTYGWRTDHKANIATPLVLDDYVFISSGYSMGCALLRVKPDGDRVSLELVYARRNKPLRCHHSTSVALGTHLYGFDGDRDSARLCCLNYLDGSEVEDWADRRVKNGKIVLAGRHLIILSENGDLHLIHASPDECEIIATVPTGLPGTQNWAMPALVDGRLYVRGTDRLICYDVRP